MCPTTLIRLQKKAIQRRISRKGNIHKSMRAVGIKAPCCDGKNRRLESVSWFKCFRKTKKFFFARCFYISIFPCALLHTYKPGRPVPALHTIKWSMSCITECGFATRDSLMSFDLFLFLIFVNEAIRSLQTYTDAVPFHDAIG